MTRRAVITGIGIAAPSGIGADEHWKTMLSGDNKLGPITLFDPGPYDSRLAGEVSEFHVEDHVDGRLAVQTDRWTWLGFAAATEALADARLEATASEPLQHAVILASSSGGNHFGQQELQRLWSGPDRTVSAYQSIAWFYAASVGQLSIKHQYKGPSCVLAAEAAGGLDGLAHAVRTIRRGSSVVLAGATEAPLSPYALTCYQRSGWLSTGTDPESAYQPFDVAAAGHVLGEGGAVFVVEELDHALERGAPAIYGEITGWGATHDGEHTSRRSGGSERQYARAMRIALDRAGLRPAEIDAVFPDALGVPAYDRTEAAALHEVFAGEVAVTTQKPLVGRLCQGAPALDVATALLAMRHGALPATAQPARPAPGCELNFVRTPRPGPVRAAMVNARGFDGFNTSLIVRPYEEP
jgi:minimal PKS chain-length factor (CLF/KS beta)